MNNKMVQEIFTSSENETFSLAEQIGKNLKGTEVILLSGDLGAGKTIFAKGIAAGLDIDDVHQVSSPSYTLVNIYSAKFPIYHIDLYRLENESEIDGLGWEDFLGQGVIVVEWGQKLEFNLDAIRIEIEILGDQKRKIRISGIPSL
ncbi:MAG: tRNA (adenosine(37)-N6)-threonylcarbamoyltransferase complex ATPase subunit type 1 TsaE [Candidatus Aminicenantes bacterium]|nr:tRNA (adenosine(37)-N6)-threonylcarbamoyltransferase complex ATPase subunit type 1 TsaE [Candidatus Aminicenantes bacterium]